MKQFGKEVIQEAVKKMKASPYEEMYSGDASTIAEAAAGSMRLLIASIRSEDSDQISDVIAARYGFLDENQLENLMAFFWFKMLDMYSPPLPDYELESIDNMTADELDKFGDELDREADNMRANRKMFFDEA